MKDQVEKRASKLWKIWRKRADQGWVFDLNDLTLALRETERETLERAATVAENAGLGGPPSEQELTRFIAGRIRSCRWLK